MKNIPFAQLYLAHGEIGTHKTPAAPMRSGDHGFGRTFGFKSLKDVPFVDLAWRVKAAYDNVRAATNPAAWSVQRPVLERWVALGVEGIYRCEEQIVVKPREDGYYLRAGNHRSLALYVLGETVLLASIDSDR